MTAALPPLDPAAVPREVRAAGPAAADGFRSALGFERVLLGELLQSALPAASPDAGPQVAQLPETLADALAAQGGIGLAASLHGTLDPAAAPAPGAGAPAGAGRERAEPAS